MARAVLRSRNTGVDGLEEAGPSIACKEEFSEIKWRLSLQALHADTAESAFAKQLLGTARFVRRRKCLGRPSQVKPEAGIVSFPSE